MRAQILDGKKIALELQIALKSQIALKIQTGMRPPKLVVILVGSDPSAQIYIEKKQRACEKVGMLSTLVTLSNTITTEALIEQIKIYNVDQSVDGILVQLPLPKSIDVAQILEAVSPQKDVDGLHPLNQGKLLQRMPTMRSCTPAGILYLLKTTQIPLSGLKAVVVGASDIVGRPMALELLLADCTVTICHSRTQNLEKEVEQAEILVAALGKPNFIPGAWIKPGAIVLDAGTTRLPSGKLVGDVDFKGAKTRASWITPVPGGVGPMTVAMLLQNTYLAYLS